MYGDTASAPPTTRIVATESDQALFVEQTTLLDLVQDGIIIRDFAHRILYLNAAAERMYGWTAEEVIGREVPRSAYVEPGQIESLAATVLAEGHWRGRILQRRRNGQQLTTEARWTLLRFQDGTPRAVFCVHTDVTERVQLEERLRQAQRLEAVGQLTGGLAHDFNNLLTVVLGYAELLVDHQELSPSTREAAQMVITAAEKGAELTKRLLAFSRQQALAPSKVDINTLVSELGALVRRTLGSNIVFEHIPRATRCQALIDTVQLETALMNLCFNARDAMPDGGRLTVETTPVDMDDDYVLKETELAAGRYVCIAVSDTGTGMPEDVLARVFEPFFTTKEVGKGSGLGLSMVYGFLKQSGGHVKVYSSPGLGTTVKLYVPSAGDDADQPADRTVEAGSRGGSEWILMVEDDEMVREHVAQQLRQLGYRVTIVGDAAAALQALEERRHDLLFSDVVMPGGMNGFQLAEQVRRRRPDMPILLTSGFAGAAAMHHSPSDVEIALLSKPYRRHELARLVRETLDGTG